MTDPDSRNKRSRIGCNDFTFFTQTAVPLIVIGFGHLDFDFTIFVGRPAVRLRRTLLLRTGDRFAFGYRQRTSSLLAIITINMIDINIIIAIIIIIIIAVVSGGTRSRTGRRRFPAEIQDVIIIVGITGIFRRSESVIVIAVAVVTFIRTDRSFGGGS